VRVLVVAALVGVGSIASAADNRSGRPNIVLILADDLGYSDLGCYGGEIRTPNLDRLAEHGLRFTQFYNCARCCPTRAALMTGLYPHQAGVGGMTFDNGVPGYRGHLTPNTVTVAEVLSAAGYRTLMAGKWHLSLTADSPRNALWVSHRLDLGPFSDPKTYPVARGFDEHYGTIWGVVNFYDPFSLVRNAQPIESVPKDYFYTDALSDEAVRMIRESAAAAKSGDQAFFLYLAYTAPHWPLHAHEEDIAAYEKAYVGGWEPTRRRRYERMAELGLIDREAAKLSAAADGPPWRGEPHRDWEARAMAVHAAMVTRMDAGIGRVVEELRSQNLAENTLVLFLSDNGASPERIGRSGFDRPSHTRDGREIVYPQPNDPGPMPGPETTFAGIGRRWANAANTPFRGAKATTYEGGICTPLIAHWPATVRPAITHEAGHVIDLMATCCDLTGAAYPATRNGVAVTSLEGSSLRAVFNGGASDERLLCWEHQENRAARKGRWKIVGPKGKPWELYDLAADRTETTDLAAEHPGLVKKLAAAYDQWATRVGVEPRKPTGGR
jgi:arylsulfatase A-like enzyme